MGNKLEYYLLTGARSARLHGLQEPVEPSRARKLTSTLHKPNAQPDSPGLVVSTVEVLAGCGKLYHGGPVKEG